MDKLADLQREICAALDPHEIPFEVILVNDGSTDGTTQALDALHGQDERFKVVHFIRNYGQTAAMQAGLQHANHDIIVTMDADLQNDPRDIPSMLGLLDKDHDLVCGWRKHRQDDLVLRKLPSRAANWLISRTTGVVLHDYGCTLKAMRKEYVADIPLYGEMHRFIPIYVTWAGARMIEVPVNHRARTRGVSKYGLSRTFRVVLDLVTTIFLRDFYSNPLYFFGYFAYASFFTGLLCAGGAVWMKAAMGTWIHKNPLALLASMFILLSANAVFFGLLAEIMIRMNFEIQKKMPFRVRATRGTPPRVPLIGQDRA